MPSLLPRSPLVPDCVACCRSLARLGLSVSAAGTLQQTRGKKKNAKPVTQITVRLIKDLPGYGRKGSLVPMPMGVMRNVHFPGRTADYISMAVKKELKKNGTVAQRDFSYGAISTSPGAGITGMGHTTIAQPGSETRGKAAVRIELEQLRPSEALAFLKEAIPSHVDFYRQPILADESASAEAAPSGTNIYGSVSSADVATSIKALLASSELAGRVVLADEDINFTNTEAASAGRVKQLGDFEIEIKIKGRQETIKRHVRVLPVDASAAEQIQEVEQLSKDLAASNPIAGGEPDQRLLEIEAKLEEMDAVIAEAQASRKAPDIGGEKAYGRSVTDSRPARSEASL